MSDTMTTNAPLETMANFEEEINRSFHRISEGDLVNCTVIGVKEDAVTVDIGTYTEGIIPSNELSYDPHFSIFGDIQVGDVFKAYVLKEDDGEGNLLLSKKRAHDIVAWDSFKTDMEERRIVTVTISSAVNGGVVTYLDGIRAFIPASQLSLTYVENLETWVNKTVDAVIITVDEDKKRLVLSSKEVEKKKADALHKEKLSHVQKGIVTSGIIEKVAPYGAFVNIGDGLTGLVHISRICGKRIKSPNEVVKIGDEVKVKILDVVDGKISLDMRAVAENDDIVEDADSASIEYTEDDASTSLGSLLSKFKLS